MELTLRTRIRSFVEALVESLAVRAPESDDSEKRGDSPVDAGESFSIMVAMFAT